MSGRHAPLRDVSGSGSEFSRTDFLEDGVVERLVGHELLEPSVLLLELLQALGLVESKAPLLLPPAVVRLLGNPALPDDRCHTEPLRQLDLRTSKLPDDLFCRVALPAH